MTEAIDAVGRMLAVYPNRAQVGKPYIGAVAELLMKYPKQLALDCMNPVSGVALDSEFVPTIARIVAWLNRYLHPLEASVKWDERSAEQFAQRDRDEAQEKAEPLAKRREVAERIQRDLREAFARGDGMKPNVFVPSFAPQYTVMVTRAQDAPKHQFYYGVSLEEPTREGIWVPLEWLQARFSGPRTWQRYTDDQFRETCPTRRTGA